MTSVVHGVSGTYSTMGANWGLSSGGGWVAYAVTVPVWLAATLYLQCCVPKVRAPKMWGVPLVPWLPAASIFINIFPLGSIDAKSFMRFGIWTAALLAYYFFGLHASYDTAKALAAEADAARVEEGALKGVDGAGSNETDDQLINYLARADE